jgi:trehalose 6-phosphate synthase/phosphatase
MPGPEPAEPLSAPSAVRAAVELALSAPRLALVLDYDGTLVPFAPLPELAAPDRDLLPLLESLAARERTQVSIVSGRKRETLEGWFGTLPLGLYAEHGFWSRPAGGEWRSAEVPAGAWREPVLAALRDFTARTPGSLIEEKTAGYAWHYRAAAPELGPAQAQALCSRLGALLDGAGLEILPGDKVVEIRPAGINKGLAVARVLALCSPDTLLFAMGDDRTDEDLFAALPEGSVAVHVGPQPSRAPIRIADVAAARSLLARIAARAG